MSVKINFRLGFCLACRIAHTHTKRQVINPWYFMYLNMVFGLVINDGLRMCEWCKACLHAPWTIQYMNIRCPVNWISYHGVLTFSIRTLVNMYGCNIRWNTGPKETSLSFQVSWSGKHSRLHHKFSLFAARESQWKTCLWLLAPATCIVPETIEIVLLKEFHFANTNYNLKNTMVYSCI